MNVFLITTNIYIVKNNFSKNNIISKERSQVEQVQPLRTMTGKIKFKKQELMELNKNLFYLATKMHQCSQVRCLQAAASSDLHE